MSDVPMNLDEHLYKHGLQHVQDLKLNICHSCGKMRNLGKDLCDECLRWLLLGQDSNLAVRLDAIQEALGLLLEKNRIDHLQAHKKMMISMGEPVPDDFYENGVAIINDLYFPTMLKLKETHSSWPSGSPTPPTTDASSSSAPPATKGDTSAPPTDAS